MPFSRVESSPWSSYHSSILGSKPRSLVICGMAMVTFPDRKDVIRVMHERQKIISIELLREDAGTSNSGRLASNGCLSSFDAPSLSLWLNKEANASSTDDKSWGLRAGETNVSSILRHGWWTFVNFVAHKRRGKSVGRRETSR
jgi:hypothetical protein